MTLSAARPPDAARIRRIDAYLKAEMDRTHVPGVAVAVVQNGNLVFAKGYGLANLEHQVPVRPETVFQSGSTGKQYTAMAVLMLMEEGRLHLDDSIRKHLTDAPRAWRDITIRHLLAHTSGLGDFPPNRDLRKVLSDAELLAYLYQQPSGFAPGTRFHYSNVGYSILGFLIGRVSGQHYGDFLQARVFKPLGMTTARLLDEETLIPHRAAGYLWERGQWRNQSWVSPAFNSTADGSLYLTLADVAKWDAALYTERLVKQSTLAQAWTPFRLKDGSESPYNCGWVIRSVNGHRVLEHNGAWQGFMAMITRYVDDRLTVIVFANLLGAPVNMFAHEVARIWNPALAPPPPKPR